MIPGQPPITLKGLLECVTEGVVYRSGKGTGSWGARIAIIGAGFSGLCLGAQLKRRGIHDFVILERSAGVGGTWRDNAYPGLHCDIPSHLYCFSFAPNPNWSQSFAPGSEIRRYLEDCADRFGLVNHLRAGWHIKKATLQKDGWQITAADGRTLSCQFLIGAVGRHSVPNRPEIDGLASFEGEVFHSQNLPPDYSAKGKRIAVVGTGASSVQIVPALSEEADNILVLQRKPNWIIPRGNRAFSQKSKKRFSRWRWLHRLHRWALYLKTEIRYAVYIKGSPVNRIARSIALNHIKRQVKDPDLRQKVTPDYPIGCQQILISDDYYPALAKENVSLQTEGVDHFCADGVWLKDGKEHRLDAVILSTGFNTFAALKEVEIRGRSGQTLTQALEEGDGAHRSVAFPDFPNFFLIFGPNGGAGHNSALTMIEPQANYVAQCLETALRRKARWMTPKASATRAYNDRIQKRLDGMIWNNSCSSWYTDERGRNTALWPSTTLQYRWEMRGPRPEEFVFVSGSQSAEPHQEGQPQKSRSPEPGVGTRPMGQA